MAKYDITAPDGTTWEIEAPDDATEEQVLAYAQSQWRQLQQPSQPMQQQAFDPTEGMSDAEKFLAGVGGTFVGLYRRGKQLLNIGDQDALREEIAESRRLDAPLMKSGAAKVGNVVGNIAIAAPAAFIPGANTVLGGAAIGAGLGALQPSLDWGETIANMTLGSVGGAGGVLLGRATPGVAKAVVDPFRRKGQEKIVGETLRRFAGDQADDVARRATQGRFVEGWRPTLAEVAQNPGISILERGAASAEPQTAAALASRAMENNAAVLNAIGNIAGTADDRALAKGVRALMTEQLYKEAAEEGVDVGMAKALEPQIKNLLSRPSIQKAAQKAKELAAEEGIELSNLGSVRGLQYLKQALDDLIEKAPTDSSIGKNTLRALQTTRSDLISVLDEIAPKQRMADQAFAMWSRPVNEQAVGAELLKRLQPALGQFNPSTPNKLYADAYARAVRDLGDNIPKITGFPGAKLENVMSPGAMQTINLVGESLARRAAANELGRGVGSNTAQNLASQNIMRQIFGPVGMPQSWAESLLTQTIANRPLSVVLKPAEQRVQALLAEALLDPQIAAQLMQRAGQQPGLLNQAYQRALPVTGAAVGLLGAE